MAYEEESIIPAYPGTEGRKNKALSISNSLRESLERQSLREAGIRGVAQNGKKSWVKGGEAFAVPLI